MQIHFIGATSDVTGSMTLLETKQGKILIDAGLYQGTTEVTKKNLKNLPFDPKEILAVILTHAHLDHCGYIPRLIKLGFRGPIHCTRPTMKLARIIMNDSAHLMEKEDERILREFYSIEHVEIASSLFKVQTLHQSFKVLDLNVTLQSAGHILGATSVIIKNENETYVFSGDLGRTDDPLLFPPETCPKEATTIVMESTYGGRIRTGDYQKELAYFIKHIKRESRVGIIASFAVARSQNLITMIHNYFQEYPEEKIRLVIDGPMMTEANRVYKEFASETKTPEMIKEALEEVEVIQHIREWNSLAKKEGPLLVISSSGMITGGRIWRYLENWQDDEKATLFLPGFQSEGTAGYALKEGIRTIHDEEGKKIHWSGEIKSSEAFSSHADQNDLLHWLKNVSKEARIYLNHGEEQSKLDLKEKLEKLGYRNVVVAKP